VTQTYTSKTGNKVAVYFYWVNVNLPRECDRYGCKYDYSYCSKTEEHFELVNNRPAQFTAMALSWLPDGYTPTVLGKSIT